MTDTSFGFNIQLQAEALDPTKPTGPQVLKVRIMEVPPLTLRKPNRGT